MHERARAAANPACVSSCGGCATGEMKVNITRHELVSDEYEHENENEYEH